MNPLDPKLAVQNSPHCAMLSIPEFKQWFVESIFQGMVRIRGIECAAAYAEAFCFGKMMF